MTVSILIILKIQRWPCFEIIWKSKPSRSTQILIMKTASYFWKNRLHAGWLTRIEKLYYRNGMEQIQIYHHIYSIHILMWRQSFRNLGNTIPFEPLKEKNGNIYARKIQDMKNYGIQHIEVIYQLKILQKRMLHDYNEFLNEKVFLKGIDIYCEIIAEIWLQSKMKKIFFIMKYMNFFI